MDIDVIDLIDIGISAVVLGLVWAGVRTIREMRQDLTEAREAQASLQRTIQSLRGLVDTQTGEPKA